MNTIGSFCNSKYPLKKGTKCDGKLGHFDFITDSTFIQVPIGVISHGPGTKNDSVNLSPTMIEYKIDNNGFIYIGREHSKNRMIIINDSVNLIVINSIYKKVG